MLISELKVPLDGKLQRLTEYALITRRPGPCANCAVTTIASNHGNAVYGAGNYLTIEDNIRKLLHEMQLKPGDTMPGNFQIVLRVELIDVDDEVVNVECVRYQIQST